MSEQDYINGQKTAYARMFSLLARELAGPEGDIAEAVAELNGTRVALRRLSKRLGCNDWGDELHLADVVDKYIGRSRALEGVDEEGAE